ncbi:MAG: efflux RND transporter periplasmic adaptor subunit [Synergistota bacterium]|nr:efflux RND transporter periplasmic adaptor subunit [Synergistota bacterium]
MKKTTAVIVIILVFAGLIAFRGYQKKQVDLEIPESSILKVAVTTPEMAVFSQNVDFSASIEPVEQAAVVAKAAGRTVLRVLVDEGDTVHAGQKLAVLDSGMVDRQVEQARAAWETAEKDYQRFSDLYEEDVVSRQQLDHARNQYVQAGAAYEQAAILKSYHTIIAPVDGVVAGRYIDPGDTSNPQSPAFLLFREGDLRATGAVPEKLYVMVRPGQKAEVKADALPGKVFGAQLSRVSPVIDPVTRTGRVEVVLPEAEDLKPGMFARVSIHTGEKTAPSIPREAVRRLEGTGESVCYVVSGDRALLRTITTGYEEGNLVEITGGLEMDELVVLTRSQKLRDGVSVEAAEK